MNSNRSSKVIVAILSVVNVMELNKTADSRYEITGGVEGKGLIDVMEALGMEYELIIPPDGEFGRQKPNGDWTGLIGMTARGEADLAVGGLGITLKRLKVLDFTKPLMMGYLTFAIGRAEKQRLKNAYIYPFRFAVWASFLFLFFAMTAAMWLIFEKKYSVGRIVFELFGIFLRQPFKLCVGSWKSNFILGVIFFYGLVMTSGYSGVLLSFMTVPMQGETVETLKQLSDAVAKGTHRCHVMKGTFLVPYLLANKEKYLQQLGKEINRNKWYLDSMDKSAVEVISPHDAIISSNLFLDVVYGGTPEQQLKYLISKDSIALSPYGVAVNRKFCCKKKVNDIITRFWESGMISKYIRETAFEKWISNKKVEVKEEKQRKITTEDISGALIILCAGYAISFLTLLVEKLVFKYA